jgi:hypothetical protein
MAYQLAEESGPKLTSRPSGGYSLGVTTVASNKLALVNNYTKDRRPTALKVPLTPDRNRRGSRGGSASKSPRLRSATRTIV